MATHDYENFALLFDGLLHLCSKGNESLLEGFLAGDLNSADMKMWKTHLKNCKPCRDKVKTCDEVGATWKREWPADFKPTVSGPGRRSENLRQLRARFKALEKQLTCFSLFDEYNEDVFKDYVYGTLPDAEKRDWDKHLLKCEHCVKAVTELREVPKKVAASAKA